MDNEMIKKWEAMLATLTAAQKSSLICSEAEIEQVEKELGFKFPAGYKENCRVFGSGGLGQGDAPEFFRVYCPCPSPSSVDIRQTGHNLIGLNSIWMPASLLKTRRKQKYFIVCWKTDTLSVILMELIALFGI